MLSPSVSIDARASACSAKTTWLIAAVVGVMPVGSTSLPSSAFTNVDLPWLNSPSTTRWKRSSSSLGMRVVADVARQGLHADGSATLGELLEAGDDLALGLLVVLEEDHGRGSLEHARSGRRPACRRRRRLGLPVGSCPVTLRVERRVREQAQRLHALGHVGVRAEQLGVAADAASSRRAGARRYSSALNAEPLSSPSSSLTMRAQRLVEVAHREQRGAIAGDLGAPRPRLQRHDRGLDDPAHEEHGRVGQVVQRGRVEDVAVLDVAELVADRRDQLGVGRAARRARG